MSVLQSTFRDCRSILSLAAHNKAYLYKLGGLFTDRCCCHNVLGTSGRACLACPRYRYERLLLVDLGLVVGALCVVAAVAVMDDP
jgi:hypothetical protein